MIAPAARVRVLFGTCVQAIPGETECGDACVTIPWSRGTLLVLVDGLGHGPRAAEAASAFVACVEAARELQLDEMFARAHRALLKTRGAVAAAARFDESRGEVQFGGVGNISTLLFPADGRSPIHPIAPAGVLGSVFRSVKPQTFPFAAADTLLMHSDGVRARFDLDPIRGMALPAGAEWLVRTHGKGSDDAACGLARGTAIGRGGEADEDRREGEADGRHIPIRMRGDAECAASAARDFARSAGFSARQQWEISIAVSELVTNVLKFAGDGDLRLRHVREPREAVVVVARDRGRGITDLAAATTDGFSEGALLSVDRARREGQGLGVGLGSVHRMMNLVDIQSDTENGTRIVATKFRS